MDIADLKVFKAVADHGGVIAAAQHLHRVPSNVTARLQKLETDLDAQLFRREKNRLHITPSGKTLLSYANQILTMAQEARQSVQLQAPCGDLRLGCMEAVAASRMANILVEFHNTYPDVRLNVLTKPTGDLIEAVLAGDLDVAFVADKPKSSELVAKPIFREDLVLVAAKNLGPIKKPADLGDDPVALGFTTRCAYRNRLTRWLKTPGKVMEMNSYHTILNCVIAGMGVGLVPQTLVDQYPFKSSLATHELPKSLATSITHVIWRKDQTLLSVDAFFKCAKQFEDL